MVGGGVRGGIIYGVIDEYGYKIVFGCVEIYDLYVMMFYFLGMDYKCMIFCFSGWDMWLMDVYGKVVYEVLS